MATHGSFTVKDDSDVNHTFTRVNIDGSNVRFQERTTGPAIGWANVDTNLRPPVPGNAAQVYKAMVKFTMPVIATETINGVSVPKRLRGFTADLSVLIPADATEAERELFGSLLPAICASGTIQDLITALLPLNGNP